MHIDELIRLFSILKPLQLDFLLLFILEVRLGFDFRSVRFSDGLEYSRNRSTHRAAKL